MGRIAEALKRAQQERAERLEAHTAALDAGAVALEDAPRVNEPPAIPELLREPAPPKPFLVHAKPIPAEQVDTQIATLHAPAAPISEKYRSLRTRLVSGQPAGASRVLAITSSLPGEGKSVTAGNLAFSLAELRHLRVVAVDMDLRGRGLSKLLGAADRPGISDILRGEKTLADVCLPLVRPNLFFVPAGDPGDVAPSELLAGPRPASLFREINNRFHFGLIDTPPVSTVADTGLIAPLCHSVLMVVRMRRTPEPTLRSSIAMLQANHIPIAGCVLAGCVEEEAYVPVRRKG